VHCVFVRTDPPSYAAAVAGADDTCTAGGTGDVETSTAAAAATKPDNDIESTEPVPSDLCQDSADGDTHQSIIGWSLLGPFVAVAIAAIIIITYCVS